MKIQKKKEKKKAPLGNLYDNKNKRVKIKDPFPDPSCIYSGIVAATTSL